MTTPPSRTPSAPPRSRPIVVEVAPTRHGNPSRRTGSTPSAPHPVPRRAPPGTLTAPAPPGAVVVAWECLSVVGMVAPPPSVDLGIASPLYRVDNHPGIPPALRGAYMVGRGTAEGVVVRVSWPDEPPPEAATPFVYPPPRSTPGGTPPGTPHPGPASGGYDAARIGAPASELPGVVYDDWTPREWCAVGVIRGAMWKRLRAVGVTPPWAFRAIGAMPSGARCRVALVDRRAFHAWRRALGWESLATVRGYLRDPAWHDNTTTRAHVERVRRLAFDAFPQYTMDRSAVKALTVLTSPAGPHRDRALAALNTPRWAADAESLFATMREWLRGGPATPPGLDSDPQGPRLGASDGGHDTEHEGE